MPTVRSSTFNPRSVGSLEPRPGRTSDVWSEKGSPLKVRVHAGGEAGHVTRTYMCLYRAQGRLRWHRLGAVGDLDLSDARKAARDILIRVANGQDPSRERVEAREEHETLGGLLLAYVHDAAGVAKRSKRTSKDYVRLARLIGRDAIGKLPALAVTRGDLRRYLEAAAVERGGVMSNRMLALVRASCRWALRTERLEADPTAGLVRARPEKPADRVLSDPEIRALWEACPVVGPVVGTAVRLLVLLGQRRGEVLAMRWQDLALEDDARAAWEIPAEFRKGQRAHVVPLPPLAVRLLRDLRAVTGSGPAVFAGPKGAAQTMNPARWVARLKEHSGIADLKLHHLRRTCASGCLKCGASLTTVSRLLGHALVAGAPAVTLTYARFADLDSVRSALVAWSRHVAAVVEGEAAGAATVVPFEARR